MDTEVINEPKVWAVSGGTVYTEIKKDKPQPKITVLGRITKLDRVLRYSNRKDNSFVFAPDNAKYFYDLFHRVRTYDESLELVKVGKSGEYDFEWRGVSLPLGNYDGEWWLESYTDD